MSRLPHVGFPSLISRGNVVRCGQLPYVRMLSVSLTRRLRGVKVTWAGQSHRGPHVHGLSQ